MTTFNDGLASDGATTGAFLATFSQTIIRWPLGVEANAQNVTALFDSDFEASQLRLNSEYSDRIRDHFHEEVPRVAILEMAIDQDTDDRDKWVIDGEVWGASRVYGRDAGMKTVLVERHDGHYTSRAGRLI